MSRVKMVKYDPSGQTAVATPVNAANADLNVEAMHIGPGIPSAAWCAMAPVWDKIDSCLGGTETMRLARTAYLPQHQEESNGAYLERLAKSVFTNFTLQTVKSWTGKPFSEPIRVNDDVPEEMQAFFPDVDLCGNHLQVFAREWFQFGLQYAFAHTLVEFPRVDKDGDKPRTVADDIEDNLRPYFVLLHPRCLIDARRETYKGQERITHIRIRETVMTENPENKYEQIPVERIRSYWAGPAGTKDGYVELFEWQQIQASTNGQGPEKWDWVKIDEWEFNFDGIPLVTFYANRTAFMEGKPPIEDVADLNIAHWQSESDQVNILTVTRFPQLVAKGTLDAKGLVVGPNKVIKISDPNGDLKYVEHNGAAINAGKEHSQGLEERIASFGTQFLRKQPGRVTATARTLDTAEATSELQDTAIRFSDALDQALQLMADWMGIEEGGRVDVQTKFGLTEGSPESLQVLEQSAEKGLISRPQYVKELQQRGVLSDLFDPKANETELSQQMDDEMQREMKKAAAKPQPAMKPPAKKPAAKKKAPSTK